MNKYSTYTSEELVEAFSNLEVEICKHQNSVRGVGKTLASKYETVRAELLRRLTEASNAGNLDAGNMTVIIFDKRNATLIRVENVVQIQSAQKRISGHLTNIWCLITADNSGRSFPMRHYELERVEK